MQVEIGRARHQPVLQIHVRSPWSQSPQCLSSSGTTQAHTLLRVPDGSSLAAGKNTISPSFFLSRAECVSSALQTCFSLFCFIFIHNVLVQTLIFAKAYQRPPRPPPRKKTGGASSPFSGGRIAGAGFRSPRAGAGSDGKRRQGLTRLHSLHLIHLRFPWAQPPLCEECWWKLLPQTEFSGSEAYAVEATHKAGSLPPQEPTSVNGSH